MSPLQVSEREGSIEVGLRPGPSLIIIISHPELAGIAARSRCGLGSNGGSRSRFFDPVACSNASLRISPASSCRAAVAVRAPGSAQGSVIGCRYDLFAAASGRQRPLGHQPAPGEELVWGNAMSASHQAYRHARLERLLDHRTFSDAVQRRRR
jgi:hypothetical protein